MKENFTRKGPDPGSGKNSSLIPDPRGKKAPYPDPQQCRIGYFFDRRLYPDLNLAEGKIANLSKAVKLVPV
jgi:hypothetical protein